MSYARTDREIERAPVTRRYPRDRRRAGQPRALALAWATMIAVMGCVLAFLFTALG